MPRLLALSALLLIGGCQELIEAAGGSGERLKFVLGDGLANRVGVGAEKISNALSRVVGAGVGLGADLIRVFVILVVVTTHTDGPGPVCLHSTSLSAI